MAHNTENVLWPLSQWQTSGYNGQHSPGLAVIDSSAAQHPTMTTTQGETDFTMISRSGDDSIQFKCVYIRSLQS